MAIKRIMVMTVTSTKQRTTVMEFTIKNGMAASFMAFPPPTSISRSIFTRKPLGRRKRFSVKKQQPVSQRSRLLIICGRLSKNKFASIHSFRPP